MAENLRLARLYMVMLVIVTVGRWVLGFQNVPYEKGTDKLSIFVDDMRRLGVKLLPPCILRSEADTENCRVRLSLCSRCCCCC